MAEPARASDTRFLDTDGGRIAYDVTDGDGDLVIAVPGMGDLRSEYRFLRPDLVDAGYRVATMDVRGHGESSVRWDDYSARAVGRDAIALADALGARSAVLLGNSFAAGAALWAAQDAPDRVRGVVLLGPIVRDQAPSPAMAMLFQVGFGGPWKTEFWVAYWNSLFPTRKPADHDEARERLLRNLNEPGRTDALLGMLTLSKADTASIVSRSRVPALVVMGTLDPDFADAAVEARWLGGQLGTEPVIVEGAGHYPHAEMPERVAPAVLSFLRTLRA